MSTILTVSQIIVGAIFIYAGLRGTQFTWGGYNPNLVGDYPNKMPPLLGRIIFGSIGVGLLIVGFRHLLRIA
jgi:hypothetical protein